MLRRWRGAPPAVRASAAATVLVLAYGAVVHLAQLITSGFDPHPGLPPVLRTYFTALTVLDPLAAVLLARRHRSGLVLALAVLVTDAAANGWANYGLDPSLGITPGRVGQAVTTALALCLLAAAPGLWRWTSARSSYPPA